MNQYRKLIRDNLTGIQEKGIATKILQHLDRIRNGSSVEMARRWVMELLQNARDVADDGVPLSIRIAYDGETLRFSHNGKPFSVKNILAIVHQVSSKGEAGDGAVGQFGTGFITTYQLSEEVELRSVMLDTDADGNQLAPQPFHIHLDRRGHDYHEMR